MKKVIFRLASLPVKVRWLSLLAIIALIIIYCYSGQKQVKDDFIPVTIAVATKGQVYPIYQAPGTVETSNDVAIKPRVDGQLLKIHFVPGQMVHAGDLLFSIDPATYKAQLVQAQAVLQKDQAAYANASATVKRYQKLSAQGFISKEYYDQIKANEATAKATVAADQAAVDNANLLLSYTEIRSPINGRAGNVDVHPGYIIKTTDTSPLVIINQFSPINVKFSLPSQNLPFVQQALVEKNLQVTVTAKQDHRLHAVGTISFIDNQINPATGTVMMKGSFPNHDQLLWPGQFVDVTVAGKLIPDVILIPTLAIQFNQQQKPYVYIIDEHNQAHQRLIKLGPVSGDNTSVLSGLNAGEKVVTRGQFRLTNNIKVKVVKDIEG